MAIRDMKAWFDLDATVAVVVGLLMVAYEVRQSNVYARADANNSVNVGWETLSLAEIETGVNSTWAKHLRDPNNLTAAEIADIRSYLTAVMSLYGRNEILHRLGLVENNPLTDIGNYFSTQLARDWFYEQEFWIRADSPKVADAIVDYIESTPIRPIDAAGNNQ